jgi:hypothetical protein
MPDDILVCYPRGQLGSPLDRGIADAHASITVVRCVDHGPGTKLLGAIEHLGAPSDALIVTVDDDILYDPHLVEALLAAHAQHPDDALGFRGWLLDARGGIAHPGDFRAHRFVDVLEGWAGALYPRRCFGTDLHDARLRCPSCFWVDDVWISGYLAERGVVRRLVARHEAGLRLPRLSPSSAIDALRDHPDKLARNAACAARFAFRQRSAARDAAARRLPRVRRTLSS